ncbi:conserved hypothetical protein [Sporisorium reilianum SRZ2]|uniref:Uncharacterized protein n=1 Tax=Sporisorium reilianum (strain SRZ2) TaxID=999809 RepID=E6ZPK0_SPORE|nr:conserved hypothetical protein [Sporisorium reilianum SRZ2]
MARSTQTSPGPSSGIPTRSAQRRAARPIVLSDSESACDADESCSSDAATAARRSKPPRLPRFASASEDDSDVEVVSTIGTDADLLSEDDAYLHDLAQATQLKADVLSQRLRSPGENREKLLAQLVDPVKRSDVRMKKFGNFFNVYLDEARKPGEQNEQLLEVLEMFLADLMDCVDHPQQLYGWNPFAALADMIEVGALVRTPTAIQSCSRLTLGADWGMLSPQDEARIGPRVMVQLYKLHFWRKAEIDELLARWSGKFPRESTCRTCDQDPWEIFLLTTVLSMIKYGTKHSDKETASDTSSEEGSQRDDEDDDEAMDIGSDGVDEHDVDERDDHRGLFSDSDSGDESDFAQHVDPRLLPLEDTEEPPRADTSGLQLRQSLLKNYGPNQHVLRIISMDSFGGGDPSLHPQFRVCPRCGFRFDGKEMRPGAPAYDMLHRAVSIARDQIAALQEVIDLPTS